MRRKASAHSWRSASRSGEGSKLSGCRPATVETDSSVILPHARAGATQTPRMIPDCHIHIQPMEMLKPQALELMKKKRPNFAQIAEFCRSPLALLKYLDACGVDRAVLINYVAPEVIGFTNGVNQFVADYVKTDPKRLLSCGSLHPRHTSNVLADVEQILRLGIRMIKIHPPHQLLFPNDYLNGVKELEIIYRAAEANGVPVMFHTGTSIFPWARNKYGDPMYIDDVAVDFPKLKILLAHGGRPLWMDTAFFLLRRHPNVYLDIGGIPPKALLKYFPRLDEIADKTLFGTDWPGPGVPDIKKNLDEFRALPLSQSMQDQILTTPALALWPPWPAAK